MQKEGSKDSETTDAKHDAGPKSQIFVFPIPHGQPPLLLSTLCLFQCGLAQ